MGFGEAIQTCLAKYATFRGRASRSEYWWFYLFFLLVLTATAILDMALLGYDPANPSAAPWLSVVGLLALFLPSLAAAIRRLHDTDKSGWWYLLTFVPVVGGIVLLIFLLLRGTAGSNRFGPDPLA